jgi:hypothetical protein
LPDCSIPPNSCFPKAHLWTIFWEGLQALRYRRRSKCLPRLKVVGRSHLEAHKGLSVLLPVDFLGFLMTVAEVQAGPFKENKFWGSLQL